MICYRDRGYCNRICETSQCDRNVTPAVQAEADKWWATWKCDGPAPIHYTGTYARVCGEYRPPVATHSAKALDSIPRHGTVQSEVFAEADPNFGGVEKTGNGAI